MANYIQPNTPSTSGVTGIAGGNPAPNSAVTISPVLNGNVLQITGPLTRHLEQPDIYPSGVKGQSGGVPVPTVQANTNANSMKL